MATVNPSQSEQLSLADRRAQTSLLSQSWWALTLRGVVAIIVGVLAFVMPGITVAALALLIAVYFVVDGVLAIIAAIRAARARKRWWPLVLEGIAGIGVGVIEFFWPGLTVLALVYFVAIWAIITGVLGGLGGAYVDGAPRWLLVLSGVLSVLLGLVMISQPLLGLLAVAWWFGAYALLFGITLVVLGLRLRGQPARDRLAAYS